MKKLINYIAKKVWNEVGISLNEGITTEESLKATYKVASELLGEEIAEKLIVNLLEADDDDKYSHVGKGVYVKKGDEKKKDAQRFKKDGDKYTPIQSKDTEKEDDNKFSKADQQAMMTQAERDAQVKADKATDSEIKGNFSPESEKILSGFNSRIEKSSMSDEAKTEAKSLVQKISILYDDSKSKDEIIDTLTSMNISVSSNKKKLYLDDMRKYGGGLYKILGDGTKGVMDAISKMSNYIELPEDDNKMSIEIEAAAKPDLGSQNIRAVYKKTSKGFTDEVADPNVEKLFQTPPLDRIETTKFKSLFGPVDENGNLKTPSSEHSKEYLKFSIENNVSVDNTIKVLEKYANEGKISNELATSVKEHKDRMNNVLNNMEVPSEEAANAIDESYARMFDELMKQNQDLASRMLKQFAEMRLYDSEVAKGDEAYLPGDGSFPAGDKLVFKNGGGSTERVSFVSVKYGKNGDVYGCPANSKALQTLHPDESKRENQGQYIGEAGYTLAVNDKLVSDLDTTKKSITSMLTEIPGVSDLFRNDEVDKISNVVYKTKQRVEQLKARYESDGKIDKVGWSKLQKDILKDPELTKLNTELKSVVSPEKFSKIIGSRNGRVAAKQDFGASHFMSGLSLANQIVTSNGYQGVTHNKQYYDNGTLKNTTVAGTTDRDEWYINFRMYRTAGRNGGGAQTSYIGAELKEKYGDSTLGELK